MQSKARTPLTSKPAAGTKAANPQQPAAARLLRPRRKSAVLPGTTKTTTTTTNVVTAESRARTAPGRAGLDTRAEESSPSVAANTSKGAKTAPVVDEQRQRPLGERKQEVDPASKEEKIQEKNNNGTEEIANNETSREKRQQEQQKTNEETETENRQQKKKRQKKETKENRQNKRARRIKILQESAPGYPDLMKLKIGDDGSLQVAAEELPIGWIGAYSPESRKLRIIRFLEKRNRRVWRKCIKYDVRKLFADSRLRAKGRFVKRDHEELMRELMSLT